MLLSDHIYLHHHHADTQRSLISQLGARMSATWEPVMW